VTHSTANITDVNQLHESHPARKQPWRVIRHGNALFFDPGLIDNRQTIVAGVAELVQNYDIAGIHLDDYFYPGVDFNDGYSFRNHGGGLSLEDWRRENVNKLIREIQAVIKEINPDVRFGVSPFAIWQNARSSPLGSETSGNESYRTMFADTRLWVKEGWIDYINPQIYWYIGFGIADYAILLDWWADVCEGTGVDLYIGHAAYREEEGRAGWNGEIIRQLQLIDEKYADRVQGSIFFRYKHLLGNVGRQLIKYYSDKDDEPIFEVTELSVAQPSRDTETPNANYNIVGASNPNYPLLMNGNPVQNRTTEGFFNVYVSLEWGTNTFRFTNGGMELTRVITRKNPAPTTGGGGGTGNNILNVNTPLYATVTADAAWTFNRASTANGSDWMLLKGQRDLVTGRTENGNWVRLSSGLWVESAHVSQVNETAMISNVLTDGQYIIGENTDTVTWKVAREGQIPAVNVTFDGNEVKAFFPMHTQVPPLTLHNEMMFEKVYFGRENGLPYYAFVLKQGVRLEGFYTTIESGGFSIHFRRARPLAEGDYPLDGFTFVIDAGHGGDDYGAVGPMGRLYPEKYFNLVNSLLLAQRLEAKGATVELTRSTDTNLSLLLRTEKSRNVNPDMFLSIHANSVAATTDATTIHGITFWYRNPNSKPLADLLMDFCYDINPLTTRWRNSNQANFYVCRPVWTPSVLVEVGFMPNIHDFSWMLNRRNQELLADRIVGAILKYYE
jgi:N-acetylmuramoyl-L-alanine amidase